MKIEGKESIKKLFKELGVNYLTSYYYTYTDLKDFDLKSTPYYRDNADEFEYLSKEYKDEIESSYVAPVYINKTEDRGFGLFSLKDINEGEFVGIYFGVVREQEEDTTYDETGFGTDYAWDYPDEPIGHPTLEIDAKPMGSEMRFANHSFNANLNVEHTVVNNQWYIFFIANRDIKKDEELTISYGEEYWDTEYRTMS
jgi:SET domain-containing protein